MKDLFKKITKPLFIFSLFILISCEKDLYEEKVKQQHNSQSLLLRGKDAEKAAELLKKRLSQGNHIISPSPYARVLNVTIGTISYDEVLKVIDEMGKRIILLNLNDLKAVIPNFTTLFYSKRKNPPL